jgi:tRNA dimethylallyltransferase
VVAGVNRANRFNRLVAVVGPTAVGKSEFGVALARRLDGEVINADSMQLYQGMDIGTAKLSVAERGGIPHHLLDIWPVTQTASVAEYQSLARAAIAQVQAARRVPVLVGGSGLYVRAVLDDLVFPGADTSVRAALEAELSVVGPEQLHARLAAVDPAVAATILPTNGRRIVRALEVMAIGGRPFTGTMPPYSSIYDVVLIGLDRETAELDARVAARVDMMWSRGLVDEVRHLAESCGLRSGVTASRALGYKQVLAMLDGTLTDSEARSHTVSATKRFVRRQRSWFRPDPRVRWLGSPSIEQALELIG